MLVAALVDNGAEGQWADGVLSAAAIVGPHLLPVETVNMLRKAVTRGLISDDVATLAQGDLHDIPVELVDFRPVASRVWELRHNVSAYDGWYVALAEALDAPLATLDLRLRRASGPRCEFLTPTA